MRIRRWMPTLAAAVVLAGVPAMDAQAARKKIKTVSVEIESDIEIGQEVDDNAIRVETSSDKYDTGEYTILNGGFRWESTDEPLVEIYLYADDDYYFSLDKENVFLKGAKAELQSMKREDSSSTLILTVKLESMANSVGSIGSATFESTGLAYWEPSMAATGYDVRLFKNGTAAGQIKHVESNMYNFASDVKSSGSYQMTVRGYKTLEDGTKETGSWVKSNEVYLNTESVDPNAVPPSTVAVQGQWKQDASGWWYQYPDGSYPKNSWAEIFDQWYFFNDQGYMVTGWVDWNGKQYYLSDSGAMLVNTTTPDGAVVGLDGSRQ